MTNEIDELIWKVLDGNASSGEIRSLQEWVNRDKGNRSYFHQLKKIWNMMGGPRLSADRKIKELDRYLHFMHSKRVIRKAILISYYKYAAILFIPLMVGVYWLWRDGVDSKNIKEVVQNVIRPGMTQAVLTMDDGSIVALQHDQVVDISLQGKVRVVGSGEGIAYENCGQESGKIQYNTLSTPVGGEYFLVLSDGTKVYLNADSKLKYPVAFTQNTREVELEGEAYFEVHKDTSKPFVVHLKGAAIEVLGTSFNINAYGDDGYIYTTLVNGAVRFSSLAKEQEVVLEPGMQSVMGIQTGEVYTHKIDVDPFVAWREGRFVFESMDLDLIMRQLQRWYAIDVIYEDAEVKENEFRGVINRDMDLNKVLSIIEKVSDVTFEIQGRTVTILNKK